LEDYLPEKREPTDWVPNKEGIDLAVWVDEVPNSRGVFYGQHGMFEGALSPHNQAVAEVLREFNFTTVFFDASHHKNYTEGKTEELTWDTHFSDLEVVIEWGQQQQWSHPTYGLYGRSIGGTSSLWHAAHNQYHVNSVIALTPPISGEKLWTAFDNLFEGRWKERGLLGVWNSVTGNEVMARFDLEGMSHQYDLLHHVHKLTMPTLLFAGEQDKVAPVQHIREFHEMVPGFKKFEELSGKDHKMLSVPGMMGPPDEYALFLIRHSVRFWIEDDIIPNKKAGFGSPQVGL